MKQLTNDDRAAKLDLLIEDREDRLARNRFTLSNFNTSFEVELAMRNASAIAAELNELNTARAAIRGE